MAHDARTGSGHLVALMTYDTLQASTRCVYRCVSNQPRRGSGSNRTESSFQRDVPAQIAVIVELMQKTYVLCRSPMTRGKLEFCAGFSCTNLCIYLSAANHAVSGVEMHFWFGCYRNPSLPAGCCARWWNCIRKARCGWTAPCSGWRKRWAMVGARLRGPEPTLSPADVDFL